VPVTGQVLNKVQKVFTVSPSKITYKIGDFLRAYGEHFLNKVQKPDQLQALLTYFDHFKTNFNQFPKLTAVEPCQRAAPKPPGAAPHQSGSKFWPSKAKT